MTPSTAQPGKEPVAELTDVTRTYKMGDEHVNALTSFNFTFHRGAVSYTHLTLPTICSV